MGSQLDLTPGRKIELSSVLGGMIIFWEVVPCLLLVLFEYISYFESLRKHAHATYSDFSRL